MYCIFLEGIVYTISDFSVKENRRWFVQHMKLIYNRNVELPERKRFKRNIIEEPRIQIVDLEGISDIKTLFDRYRFGLMGKPLGSYSLELIFVFNLPFATLVDLITLLRQQAWDQPPLSNFFLRYTI